jgi:glutaredoxin 3
MAVIEIYTSPFCPYCWRAKRLLEDKGAAFTELTCCCIRDGARR